MSRIHSTHPSPEQLKAFGLGQLPPRAQADIERHVAECDSCCRALQSVPDDVLLEQLRQAPTSWNDTRPNIAHHADEDSSGNLRVPKELINHPRYRIVKQLGSGGMGVVYQAEHRLMERPVALKVISRELTRHPLAVTRFRREVKTAARLAHPNIVTAHDAEQAGELHFLVMEYVEGVSLARLVEQRGALPVAQACHYVRQAAKGLKHAHEQGMVHRDIKPQNLMLTRKGQIKILDFGLARFARECGVVEPLPAAGGRSNSSPGLTAADTVLGTPDYIAPEQASDSRQADIRSDIYSLGCTLYHLLRGRVPFPQGSSMEKLLAHAEQDPRPLTEVRNDLPAELLQVIQRMMAKQPAQRFQTPAEVVEALAPFARSATASNEAPEAVARPSTVIKANNSPTVPYRRRRTLPFPQRPRRLIVAVGVLVFGFTGLLLPSLFRSNPTSTVMESRTAPRELKILYVMAPKNNSYSEYQAVHSALQRPDVKFVIASTTLDPVTMDPRDWGDALTPVLLVDRAHAADCDAVIFGGGIGMAEEYPQMYGSSGAQSAAKLIQEILRANKPLAAIGKGVPCVLADKGILQDKQATGSDEGGTRTLFKQYGVQWVNQPVVVEGFIITVRDAQAAPEFGRILLNILGRSN